MDHVERGHVVIFLPQDEEEGVEKLCELGKVVPPRRRGHPQSHGVVGPIDGLAHEVVVTARHGNLVQDPGAEQDLHKDWIKFIDADGTCDKQLSFLANLEKVVDDDGVSQIEGFSIFHNPWSQELDTVKVEAAEEDGREGAVHEEPIVHPAVPVRPDFLQKRRAWLSCGLS